MTSQEEHALIEKARRFDTEAVGTLYDAHFDEIFRYVARRSGDDQNAYDITAEVFLKAFRKLSSFQLKKGGFRAYLYRIAHNAVIDFLRKQPIQELPEYIAAVNEYKEVDRQMASTAIQKLISELNDVYGHVLILRFWQDKSVAETANIIGKSE